jgi:Ran GTPase-activating protein (RanGAP) involved in mRNA processing and transport
MESFEDRYHQILSHGEGEASSVVSSRRWWKVGIALIGASCLVVASMTVVNFTSMQTETAPVSLAFDASPEAIEAALKRCETGYNRIFLDGAPLQASGAELVAAGIHRCTNLEFLQLTECQIPDQGVIAISKALQANPVPALKELFLGKNQMTDVGAQELAVCLPMQENLQRLYLNENQIADVGVAALAKAIPQCLKLEDVFLGMNQISDPGAIAMAEGLSKSPSLLRLYLNKLKFGEEGGKALAQGRLGCKTLKVLGVYDNNLPEYLLPKLAVAGKYVPADTKDDKKMKMQQNRMMMRDTNYDDEQ